MQAKFRKYINFAGRLSITCWTELAHKTFELSNIIVGGTHLAICEHATVVASHAILYHRQSSHFK